MNWLAHLQLAGDRTFERLGQLAGDFVRGLGIADVDPDLRPGLRAHRAIDAFTDAHPMVRRSRARLVPAGRFSGVLVDVLYDHVLARDWPRHTPGQRPLRAFVDRVHVELVEHRDRLPPDLRDALPRLIGEDWLASYGSTDGLRRILVRMEGRLRRPAGFSEVVDRLDSLRAPLSRDFAAFWPDLVDFATRERAARERT